MQELVSGTEFSFHFSLNKENFPAFQISKSGFEMWAMLVRSKKLIQSSGGVVADLLCQNFPPTSKSLAEAE